MRLNNKDSKAKILISIPSTSHVEIAIDELKGLEDCGYVCEGFDYAGKEGVSSSIGRLLVILSRAFALIVKAYRFRPDIIYFNSRLEILGSSRDTLTIALFKCFYFRKVLFMIKSHGSDLFVLSDRSLWFNKIVKPFLKNQVAAWLFLSTEERDFVVNDGYFEAHKLFVTKNIVRSTQFKQDDAFRTQLGIGADEIILLYTGRLIKEKGIYEILAAFEQLIKCYPVKLIIVGDGAEYTAVKESVTGKKLNSRIIFVGFIPEQAVVPYYANADVLVFPTYFPEGFPMALFNAVAAGMAVVTTQIRAAKDYLVAPDNCLWVKPKDSNHLEAAIAMLLESPELMLTMRENNLQKGKEFNQETVCQEISLFIANILTTNHKP